MTMNVPMGSFVKVKAKEIQPVFSAEPTITAIRETGLGARTEFAWTLWSADKTLTALRTQDPRLASKMSVRKLLSVFLRLSQPPVIQDLAAMMLSCAHATPHFAAK